ncbi:hypothetical protein [Piscirickettsia salmonis]|uniref:hypothetical protein n=1 Tax=Piscirickettsia salmonis TaxID=1238 RepID=UPI0012BAD066|nr:hypothetical protein [Piscirickettsia salmonis]
MLGAKPSALANKFAQNSIYLSSQQATRYFGKLPLRVVVSVATSVGILHIQ